MKNKLIPDVSDILESIDKHNKFKIRHPKTAKEKAMKDFEIKSKSPNEHGLGDINTVTLGDLISAAHTFNRECVSSMSPQQRSAYFTMFMIEERTNRLIHHHTYIQ